MAQSVFQSNESKLAKMSTGISAGKSVIGGAVSSNPKEEAKLNSLTMLLGDEDNFADMFA